MNNGILRERQALAHLKDKEYKRYYESYSKISICQEHFNEKITRFSDENIKHLIELIRDNDVKN